MYTRCPSCNSTFRVTAAVLQMAGGEVRCGSCSMVFNALQTLVDDWSGADFTLPGTPRLSNPEDPPATGDATNAPANDPPVPDALEFNVPETEWQRYFITPRGPVAPEVSRAERDLGDDFEPADDEAEHTVAMPVDVTNDIIIIADIEPAGEAEVPRSVEEETSDTDTWQAFLREAEGPEEEDDEPLYVLGDDAGAKGEGQVLVRRPPAPATPEAGIGPDVAASDELPEEIEAPPPAEAIAAELDEMALGEAPTRRPSADTILDWGPPTAFPERVIRPPTHAGRWLAASIVAALVLAGQAAHYFRDVLAADPGYGAMVRNIYARLGLPLHPGWPLDSYEIRGAKAIAENSGPGALDIVAEIAVSGSQAVGLPMVRVVLRDRWSNLVGSGVFNASEYLAERPPAAGVYPPGTLIPVQISLKDPGTAAQGYELDVCIPDRQLGLQCKNARDPFRR